MPTKIINNESHIKVYDPSQPVRSGGEKRPLNYPHLYQIQAGDWRISYAVEHNRLAILVLEVLTPEGAVRKDPASEKLIRKMKVRLLDWPEGGPSHDVPPEELGKKLKIKLLDLADEMAAEQSEPAAAKSKVRLSDAPVRKAGKGKITLLGSSEASPAEETIDQESTTEKVAEERKVTPLDSPTL